MRLLLDLQGAQGAAQHSGLGRYSLELARALIRGAGPHAVALLVNTALPDSAARLVREFAPLLGRDSLHRWQAPAGSAADHDPQSARRRAGEALRAAAIREAGCDALHLGSIFEGWNTDAITTWPAEWERPPTAATLHDLIPLTLRHLYLDGLWREAGLGPWYARCLDEAAACDLLLANSAATRAEALRHLGVDGARVPVIGGGVSAGFAPPAGPDPSLLARYGLPAGCVLNLGAGDPRKNHGLLLAAHALLPPALRAAHPLAIGHVQPARLRAEATAAGLAPHEFIALPFVAEADLPGLYAACALYVFPSLAEGFGLPLLEAMACGAPVIASRAGALSEVLRRADALFDPTDATALAALVERLLGDTAARADLAAHGRRLVREYSWDGVAARAWGALDGLAPRPALQPRLRLALVSPLPPVPSGIADYAAELAPALAAHYAVTLVSAAPPEGALAGRFPWLPEATLKPGDFDRVLYQMGNNPLHAPALTRLLPRIPGVVTLHDAALNDLQNWLEAQEDGPARHIASEGYGGPRTGSAGVLEAALGVALHSHHGIAMLEHVHGLQALTHLRHIPHLRAPACPPGRAAARTALGIAPDAFIIASFGLVTEKKLPGAILAAMPDDAQLVFVGAALDAMGGGQLTGRVDSATYRLWLGAADLAVQLRRDSRGETSGAVLDVLMAGLPLVVNRHGALEELPPDVALVIADVAALPAAFRRLRADAALRARLGAAGRAWALRELAPARIAHAYHSLIEASHTAAPEALLRELRRLPLAGSDIGPVAAACPAGPRQPRLWVDAALGEDVLRAILREGAAPYRAEPCMAAPPGLYTAHCHAWAALGLAGIAPPDGPATVTPRDAVLSHDPVLRGWAEMRGARLLDWPGSVAGLRGRL